MGILQVGDLDFLNRFKPAQKLECFHFEQNSPNKVKLVQKIQFFGKHSNFGKKSKYVLKTKIILVLRRGRGPPERYSKTHPPTPY
jgi:hypothetical protein